MFCKNCGSQIEDGSVQCPQCHANLEDAPSGAAPVTPAQEIPNYLVQSILVTIFCCLPFGIAAIVFAAQVNSKLSVGDYAGAMESSRKAKMFSWWAFGLGLGVQLLWLLLSVIGAIGAGSHHMSY